MSATQILKAAQQETWTSQVVKPHGGGACRKGNYTLREKECFLEIMEDYAHIIEARGNSAESRWQKEQAWETIAIRYNACSGIENLRDRTQLGILWKNLKARCKHEMATAVDPNTIAPPDPIGVKVAGLVRRGKNGDDTEFSKTFLISNSGIKVEPGTSDKDGYPKEKDDSGDVQANDEVLDQSKHASPSVESGTHDISKHARQSKETDSRKRKKTTPDRISAGAFVKIERTEDEHLSPSPVSEQPVEPECYPKGVVVVQPTAVDDEQDSPLSLTHRDEVASSSSSVAVAETIVAAQNKRVLFSINPNPKKQPVPILPKITSVQSMVGGLAAITIPTIQARAPSEVRVRMANHNHNHINQNHHNRHVPTPYERPQQNSRQRTPRQGTPPIITVAAAAATRQQQNAGLESESVQDRQQSEEHEAKMELYRVQIELAAAQLRMAEDEHRIRFAKLQIELQTAQMEHDAKASQISS